jgi:hypothetical protein
MVSKAIYERYSTSWICEGPCSCEGLSVPARPYLSMHEFPFCGDNAFRAQCHDFVHHFQHRSRTPQQARLGIVHLQQSWIMQFRNANEWSHDWHARHCDSKNISQTIANDQHLTARKTPAPIATPAAARPKLAPVLSDPGLAVVDGSCFSSRAVGFAESSESASAATWTPLCLQ